MLTISFIPFLSYNAQEENTSANAFPSSTRQSRNLSNSRERGPRLSARLWESHTSPSWNQFLLLLKEELRT